MRKLTEGKVTHTLFHMAFPILLGTVAMNTYNLVDTWYVSRLGTLPLAAMGFTFPVVTLLTFIAAGIGTGITTLTAHAIGRVDREDASRIVTHGIILMVLVSGSLSIIGYLSITPVFRQLGADARTLPLIRAYMQTWFIGAPSMALPMMGNGILISMGDSKGASRFMVFGAALNCILDPILIFGWLGLPAMGILGAALATVVSQVVSCIWLFFLLARKYSLFTPGHPEMSRFFGSCRRITHFAVPGSISMMLMPISAAVVTALISRHGHAAVAAAGAAGRVEMFAFVIPMALGISLVPFISQNFGAGRPERILEAKKYSTRFAMLYGVGIALVFFGAAPLMARLFSNDPKVIGIFILYVRVVSFGYGLMETHRYCGFLFTGIHRPVRATLNNAMRILVFLIPLSYLGSRYFGIRGIFFARLITDLVSGVLALIWVSRFLSRNLKQ